MGTYGESAGEEERCHLRILPLSAVCDIAENFGTIEDVYRFNDYLVVQFVDSYAEFDAELFDSERAVWEPVVALVLESLFADQHS